MGHAVTISAKIQLSDAQRSTLRFMVQHGPIVAGDKDRTLNVLKRLGFVSFSSGAGQTYHRDMWHITDAGRVMLAAEK